MGKNRTGYKLESIKQKAGTELCRKNLGTTRASDIKSLLALTKTLLALNNTQKCFARMPCLPQHIEQLWRNEKSFFRFLDHIPV